MKTYSIAKLRLIGIGFFILVKFSYVNAFIVKQSSDTIKKKHFTISFPLFNVVFTSSGNLQSITSIFKQKHRSALSCQFTSGNSEPILQLFPEYDSSLFYMSTEHSSDDTSEYKVMFTSDTRRITWRFNAHSYVFDVEAKRSDLSDTIIISGIDSAERKRKYSAVERERKYSAVERERKYSAVVINKHKVKNIKERNTVEFTDSLQRWIGIRDRFWTFLVRPGLRILNINSEGHKIIMHTPDTFSDDTSSFTIYAGPVNMKNLSQAGKECTYLLYPLWFWMRWLSMGLLFLFDLILFITGDSVISIVLLSISVKIIILPLYSIALRWQNEVNRQKSMLKPRLLEINKRFNGEERTKMTLAVHKELGISPLYTLKSLLGAGIQIPIFFAAYHMLSEHIALSGVSFLWISDLAFPDRLVRLPFSIPILGGYLNLFPFIMTSVSLVSSFVHKDKSLSDELNKNQQRSLFFMAAVFFLLLYASPSGMLLYWTMNNILSLLESLYTANRKRKKRE